MMKGQAATEFIIVTGIVLLILFVLLFAVANDINVLQNKKELAAVKNVGFMIQNELFNAAYVQDGYYREFDVPDSNKGVKFTLSIANNYLTVISTENSMLQEFPLPEVVGNIQFGTNIVRREGGVIYLN